MKHIALVLIALFSFSAIGQNMNEGFSMLESLQYKKAEVYFKEVLTAHPNNITAKICEARAIGLGGDAQTARNLFAQLLETQPDNFEIKLNYAESLLWNHEFGDAKIFYQTLYKEQPSNFTVVLGLANCLSNLKEFQDAMVLIEKAIALSPNNKSALNTRKYILLGKAQVELKKDRFDEALKAWHAILHDFPGDFDSLWSMGQGYLSQKQWKEAEETFHNIKDAVHSQIGLSLVDYNQGKMKQALAHAEIAKNKASLNNASLFLKAHAQYIYGLLWNSNFKKAENAMASLESQFPNNTSVHILRAQYGLYTGNFKLSETQFLKVLEQDPNSFDGLLGMANAQWAKGDIKEAEKYIEQTLSVFPGQKDALLLQTKIDNLNNPQSQVEATYSWDNGDNTAQVVRLGTSWMPSHKWNLSLQFDHRETENQSLSTQASLHQITMGATYTIKNRTKVKGSLGYVKHQTNPQYDALMGQISLEAHPSPRQFVEVGFQRELQTFNATLINERIVMNHAILQHNIASKRGLGWYTSYRFTQQSDENRRNLIFTSIYQNILKKPFIKTGLNYQYMTYDLSRDALYFSPTSYHASEAFLELSLKNKKWQGAFTVASGLQWVEEINPTQTLRLEGSLSWVVGNNFHLKAIGKYSSIAIDNATGFNYNELGMNIKWIPGNKTGKKLQ